MSEQITHEELVERMTHAMQRMSGKDLADLYNESFGNDMIYLGDNLFEQKATPECFDDGLLCSDIGMIKWPDTSDVEHCKIKVFSDFAMQNSELLETVSMKDNLSRWQELRDLMPDDAVYFQPIGAGDDNTGTSASNIKSYHVYRDYAAAEAAHPDCTLIAYQGAEIENPKFLGLDREPVLFWNSGDDDQ